MMDQAALEQVLAGLPLGGVRYLAQVGSTNDEAARWVAAGAPDLALVAADEQVQGRGRSGRRWHTPPGSALAFSVVVRQQQVSPELLPRLTALGALAVRQALAQLGLSAQIKWPNDVLVEGQKVCGVLAEAHWQGDRLEAAILGMGVNISTHAVQVAASHEGVLHYPAGCVESALGRPIDRWALLRAILAALVDLRSGLFTAWFIRRWEDSLAFRGEMVRVSPDGGPQGAVEGVLLGLERDGSLRLKVADGEVSFHFGEVRGLQRLS